MGNLILAIPTSEYLTINQVLRYFYLIFIHSFFFLIIIILVNILFTFIIEKDEFYLS